MRFPLLLFSVVALLGNGYGPLLSISLAKGNDSLFPGSFLIGLKTSEWFLLALGITFGTWALLFRLLAAFCYSILATVVLIWGFDAIPGMPRQVAWILFVGSAVCMLCMASALKVQSQLFGWHFVRQSTINHSEAIGSIKNNGSSDSETLVESQIDLRWFFLVMLGVALGIPMVKWGLSRADNHLNRFEWVPLLLWGSWFLASCSLFSCVLMAALRRPMRWYYLLASVVFLLSAPILFQSIAQPIVRGSVFEFSLNRSCWVIAYGIEIGAATGMSSCLLACWMTGFRLIRIGPKNQPPK